MEFDENPSNETLSPEQKRLWFLDVLQPDRPDYNVGQATRYRGALDLHSLNEAVSDLVERHSQIRTAVVSRDGVPHPKRIDGSRLALRIVDPQPGTDPAGLVAGPIRAQMAEPFDLSTGPLAEFTLFRLAPDDNVLFLRAHHIVVDAWSLGVISRDLYELYDARVKNGRPALSLLDLDYVDLVRERAEHDLKTLDSRKRADWISRLRGVPRGELPVEPSAVRSGLDRQIIGQVIAVSFSAERVAALRELARSHRASLFMAMLSVLDVLVLRHGGPEQFLIGTTLANRSSVGASEVVGLFANTLPVLADCSGDPTFAELLVRVRDATIDLLENQNAPFQGLLQSLGEERIPGRNPIFDIEFTLTHVDARTPLALPGVECVSLGVPRHGAKFDLAWELTERDGIVEGFVEFDSTLYSPESIQAFVERFDGLLDSVIDHPDRRVSELDMLSPTETRELLRKATGPGLPLAPVLLHDLFTAQALRTPDAPAVIDEDASITYRELDERANALAHLLREVGVTTETPVGICLPRSAAMVVAVIGVLKAGGAYVPLDTSYPEDRLRCILNDSGAHIAVTDAAHDHLVLAHAAPIYVGPERRPTPPASATAPGNLAYTIYTSGSTGRPKGVEVEHRGIAAYLVGLQDRIPLRADDRVLQLTPFGFDISVTEMFWPWLTGGATVLAPSNAREDVNLVAATCLAHRVTTVHCVPSYAPVLADALQAQVEEPGIRIMLCSAETLTDTAIQAVYAQLPEVELYNVYGATEASVDSTVWRHVPGHPGPVEVGTPIANTSMYVLDRAMNPVPSNTVGEIYLGGDNVARGYLGRPGLTADRFIPNPYTTDSTRLYRTGDLARQQPNGATIFLGRSDNQVKVRGHRVELGEIETALQTHPTVTNAVVTLTDGRLIAYTTTNSTHNPSQLREHLTQRLPRYMIPAIFIPLKSLPLNNNGKIDRNALPKPDNNRPQLQQEYQPPPPGTATTIANTWSHILGIQNIGANDNFFELGGDSILAIQVVSTLAKHGITITPRNIFEHQTITELTAIVTHNKNTDSPASPVPVAPPLAPIQRWFFAQTFRQANHWNLSTATALEEPVYLTALAEALNGLVAHHDELRARFDGAGDGVRSQRLAPTDSVQWPLTVLPDTAAEEICAALDAAQADMSLADGPLTGAVLVRPTDGSGQAQLVLMCHHLVVDAVSWMVLVEDLHTAYQQRLSAAPISLPAKTAAYGQWTTELSATVEADALDDEIDYWRSAPTRPLLVPGLSADDQADGADETFRQHRTGIELSRTLKNHATRRHGARLEELVLAALVCAVRDAGQTGGVSLLREIHGRQHEISELDTSRTVGWFTGMHPLTVDLADDGDVVSALRDVKRHLREMPRRGAGFLPLRQLTNHLDGLEEPAVTFNYLGHAAFSAGVVARDSTPVGFGAERADDEHRPHALEVVAFLEDDELVVDWIAPASQAALETVDRLRGRLVEHLRLLAVEDGPVAGDVIALTATQEGVLFDVLFDESGSGRYIERLEYELSGIMGVEELRQAWREVRDRHAMLRARLVWTDTGTARLESSPGAEVPFVILEAGSWTEFEAIRERELTAPMTATDASLIRMTVVRTPSGQHHLFWVFHHLLLDGWSAAVLLDELKTVYDARSRGEVPILPAAPRLGEYVSWLRRTMKSHGSHDEFWQRRLDGHVGTKKSALMDAPSEHPQPETYEFDLPAEITSCLESVARTLRVTLNTVVSAAWALTLGAYTAETDVVFGATLSGRSNQFADSERFVGMLINTLPVRIGIEPEQSVQDWLVRVQADSVDMLEHQHSSLSRIKSLVGNHSHQDLFNTLVLFQNFPQPTEDADAGLLFRTVTAVEWTGYPLTLRIHPGATLRADLTFDGRRPPLPAPDVARTFVRVLRSLAEANEATTVGDLRRTSDEDARRTSTWNALVRTPETATTLHRLVEETADLTPDAVAVVDGRHQLTYAELDRRANQFARRLVQEDIAGGGLIGVALPRSARLIAVLLGIQKAGLAYVPLDPDLPRERIEYIVEDAAITAVVCDDALRGLFEGGVPTVITLDRRELDRISALGTERLDLAVGPRDLAYVIYTSGSTGRPKGVAVEHGGNTDRLASACRLFAIAPGERVLARTPISFDISVWEIFLPLSAGATLILSAPSGPHDDGYLSGLIPGQRVTVAQFTPSGLLTLAEDGVGASFPSVRLLWLGGERLDRHVIEHAAKMFPSARIINMYGPTEASVWATWWDCGTSTDDSSVPIGHPLHNVALHILDPQGHEVPVGGVGELCIGGVGVARGYLGRPGLTADRFIPNPYTTDSTRLYRTGDLARQQPNGATIFLGRSDNQVKVRGHRVELGEIETALQTHPTVTNAVVTLTDGRLIAYTTTNSTHNPSQLREHLTQRLPRYMIPAIFIPLKSLPLNNNGKIDRNALPKPDNNRPQLQQEYQPPPPGTATTIANTWSHILGIQNIGANDNFFELGGDSILAIQVVSTLAKHGITITPRNIFEHQTITELTAIATHNKTATAAPQDDSPLVELTGEELASLFPTNQPTQIEVHHEH
ncbi:amino acid adenylation domain-containing protein [Polymorphospora rubra]|uniref:amino acid adenylation domain-containing protein n=1 Tax=Polymorphospora rubra TaxID=338584 RepID=UPI0033FB2641